MPVSGQELATLDFANLIGGPLNAIVEAQAKSAITTANFIKEVGFDKKGEIVNVNFKYNRKDNDGRDQDFNLTVPFLTMLPIPYITIDTAEVEFNAKITSTTQSDVTSSFSQDLDAEVGGNYWFVRASMKSKTSYQRQSANSDREERTFDMRVYVRARNADMPAGTERLLNILENAIDERNLSTSVVGSLTADASAGATSLSVSDATGISTGWTISIGSQDVRVTGVSGNTLTVAALSAAVKTGDRFFANKNAPPALPSPSSHTGTLTANVSPGATKITVSGVGPIAAGWTVTIGGETLTVSGVSGSDITFTSTLANAHNSGDSFSARK
jgi:hypothetical protein